MWSISTALTDSVHSEEIQRIVIEEKEKFPHLGLNQNLKNNAKCRKSKKENRNGRKK
jgi:hypothetical protein